MTWRPIAQSIAVALLLLSAGPTRAEDGRDFAAFYDLTNYVEAAPDAFFTLTVRLFNYSGADLTAARVSVQSGLVPDPNAPSFAPVDIAYRSYADITGNFVVPLADVQTWPDGVPRLVAEYVDAQGDTVRRPIELAWLPLAQ